MSDPAEFGPAHVWSELTPLLRRCADLDPALVVRVRADDAVLSVYAWLPFAVLVARSVPTPSDGPERLDRVVAAAELLAWASGERSEPPSAREHDWRQSLPPTSGWARLDVVPDAVVRDLVRTGALALKDAAAREGVPGAQPRAETANALLDAVVLTVTDGGGRAEVTLRALSAVTRMGFVPRGSQVGVDLNGRWTRLAAGYGSVYQQRAGLGLRPA